MRNPIKLTWRLYPAAGQAYITRGRAFQCHWLNMKPHPLCWVGEPCSPKVRVVLEPLFHAVLSDIREQPWPTQCLVVGTTSTRTHTYQNQSPVATFSRRFVARKSRRKPTVKRWKILILHTVEPDVELPPANATHRRQGVSQQWSGTKWRANNKTVSSGFVGRTTACGVITWTRAERPGKIRFPLFVPRIKLHPWGDSPGSSSGWRILARCGCWFNSHHKTECLQLKH